MKALKIITLIVAIAITLGIGCQRSNGRLAEQQEKIPVEVSTVKLGQVTQSISYSGDIMAEVEVNVFSKIPDRIEKFYVDEGDRVAKGSRIASVLAISIEQAMLQSQAALVAAKAQDANLRVEFERAERLFRENAMSQQQYDAVKTQYESVQAQVQQAEAVLTSARSQLDDATITAPISGIIGKRYYETGDMANPSLPLVKIVQMKRVKIEFNATEEDLGKLALGQEANITVKAFPGQVFGGKVSKISPILDPTTRMAEVEVLADNEKGLLKPGMYAEVEVVTGTIDNVIVVPRFTTIESTVLKKIDGQDRVVKHYYVFVVDSNRAVQKKLDILYANHRWLAVKSGIEIGDQLVVAGQNNLREGLPVLVTEKGEN